MAYPEEMDAFATERLGRRQFLALAAASGSGGVMLRPIVVSVHALLDQAAHSGRGLYAHDISRFQALQDKAKREYAVSGIHFDVQIVEGAYVRQQGYSEIPDKFLAK